MREYCQTDPIDTPKAEAPHSLDKPPFVPSLTGNNDPDTIASASQPCSSHSAGASPPVPLPCSRVHAIGPPRRRIQGEHHSQLRFAVMSTTEDARPRLRREQTPWSSPQEEEISDEDICYLPQVAEEQHDEHLKWYAPI